MWFSYFWDWVTLLSRSTHSPENYSKHCWQNWMPTQRKINFSPAFIHPRTPKMLTPNLNPWNCWWKGRKYIWSFKYRNKNFLNRTPIVQETVPRGNKWDYMKLRSFRTARHAISRANSLQNGRKISASNASARRLTTSIYKELQSPNHKIDNW